MPWNRPVNLFVRLLVLGALGLAAPPATAAEPVHWQGIEAAAGGALVIWSADRILRSDDGDTFTAAPVGRGAIEDVTIDRDGAYAARLTHVGDPTATGPTLELHPRARPPVRVDLDPDLYMVRVDAGDGELALLFNDHLERRSWDGRVVASIPMPSPCEGCEGALGQGDLDLAIDGTIRVTDTEINTCTSADLLEWQRLIRVSRGQARASDRAIALGRDDYAATWHIGAHGWLYGVSYARRLLAVGAGAAQVVAGVREFDSWPDLLVAHNEKTTMIAAGTEVWRLDGARARLLARAPAVPRALAVDARTRPWIVIEADDGDRVLRFERARGWVPVTLPDP